MTQSVEYAVEFFQECTTIYCGLTFACPFLKVMPSNEMVPPLMLKIWLFESASRTQSRVGHVNVKSLPILIWLVKIIGPGPSSMSLQTSTALLSSP